MTRKVHRSILWAALSVLLVLLLFALGEQPLSLQAQSDPQAMILTRQPATLYTDRMNPVSAERILIRTAARRIAAADIGGAGDDETGDDEAGDGAALNNANGIVNGDTANSVIVSVLRLAGQSPTTAPPVYLLPDWSAAGSSSAEMVAELLAPAAILGPEADVYIIKPRGLVGPDTDFTCPGALAAPLSRTVSRDEMNRLTATYLADCLDWWQESGIDLGAYSLQEMAADVVDVAKVLGHEEIVVAGMGMGAFVALHAATRDDSPLAQAILIRPPGIGYPFTRPDGLDALLETLGSRAADAPALFGLVPDLNAVLERVIARLELSPVAATVTDPQTGDAEVVALGVDDLRMAVGEALAAGEADALPKRLFEMVQGDFGWLGEQTLARRRYTTFDVAAVAALCRAGPNPATLTVWESAAEDAALGWGPFQLFGATCAPFLLPEERRAEENDDAADDNNRNNDARAIDFDAIDFEAIDAPLLFITGDLDGGASAAEINAVATEYLFIEDLLIENWTGRSDGAFWRVAEPVLSMFLADDYEAIPLASIPLAMDALTARPFQLSNWQAEYYNNRNLTGEPVLTRTDEAIEFEWGTDAPDPAVATENFSVRWAQQVELPAGAYRFYVWSDDGARLWIDNVLVLDAWQEGPLRAYAVDVNLVEGVHDIRFEYFDAGGNALARLRTSYITVYPDWLATYYPNPDLAEAPIVVRNEQAPNAFWGTTAPAPGVPGGNFSARWETQTELEPGAYTFRITANGGVRLYVDDELTIDAWENVGRRILEANRIVEGGGPTELRIEYFALGGSAELSARWQRRPSPTGASLNIQGPTRARTGQPVTLAVDATPEADRSISAILWDMGDNTQYNQPDIEHTYRAPGIYDVTVVVTDSGGIAAGQSRQVRVDNEAVSGEPDRAPQAVLDAPSMIEVGSAASFDAGESLGLNPIVTYEWVFGDGTQSSSAWAHKVYQVPGIYNVRLRIVDDQGLSARRNQLVLVLPASVELAPPLAAPLPDLTYEMPVASEDMEVAVEGLEAVIMGFIGAESVLFQTTEEGHLTVDLAAEQPIVLDARSSIEPEDAPIAEFSWDIADGFSTTTDPVIELVFAAPGEYRVELTVMDEAGATARRLLLIQVTD